MVVNPYTFGSEPHGRDRKVIRPTGVFNRIIFPSLKLNRPVHCEGDNERDAVALLEVMPDVRAYQEQPQVELSVQIDGKWRQVYPDLLVEFQDGTSEIRDVVRSRTLKHPEQHERYRSIGRRCRDLGFTYHLWTDQDIARQPRLDTANTICWHGRSSLPEETVAEARACLGICETVGELRRRLNVSRDDICALVLQGYIAVEIDGGLGDLAQILGRGWRDETRFAK